MPYSSQFYLLSNISWMSWNTFLAAIPFILSFLLFKPKQKISTLWVIGFLIFFAFLPNAPYVLTDAMHLFTKTVGDNHGFVVVSVWQYLFFIILGCYFFVGSYHRFEMFIVKKTKAKKELLRIITFLLMSIGVFLGRFPRLNSWEVITNPDKIVKAFETLFSLKALTYIFLFTLLLYAIFYIYEHIVIKSSVENKKRKKYNNKRWKIV